MKVKCPKCGFEDEGDFCGHCGTALPKSVVWWAEHSETFSFPLSGAKLEQVLQPTHVDIVPLHYGIGPFDRLRANRR